MKMLSFERKIMKICIYINIYIYIFKIKNYIYLWKRNLLPENTCKFHPSFRSIHYCLQGLHKMPPIRAGRDCNSYRQVLVVCLDVWYHGNVFLPGQLTLGIYLKSTYIHLKSGKSFEPNLHDILFQLLIFRKMYWACTIPFKVEMEDGPFFLQRREPNLGGICFLTSMIMEVQEMEVQNGECLGSN